MMGWMTIKADIQRAMHGAFSAFCGRGWFIGTGPSSYSELCSSNRVTYPTMYMYIYIYKYKII